MVEINLSNMSRRREDWKHTTDAPARERQAKRIAPGRQGEAFEVKPPSKGPVHPLKLPPVMEPVFDPGASRDWSIGDRSKIRSVVEADIERLIVWGMPRFLNRFPRCRADTIVPFLKQAVRGGRFRFLRTSDDEACALFVAGRSPWEPELTVEEVFVVARQATFAATHVRQLYIAGEKWAREIGAVEFKYGSSTEYDISPIARRIGYEHRAYGFSKILQPLPDHRETVAAARAES